jgi:hypothetical protein
VLSLKGYKLSLYNYIHLCRAPCVLRIFLFLIGHLSVLSLPLTLTAGLPALAIMEKIAIVAFGHVLVFAIQLIVVISATMIAMFLGKRA